MDSFCAVFFPTGCLGWILNLIESVSEGFPSYSKHAKRVLYMYGFYLQSIEKPSLDLEKSLKCRCSGKNCFKQQNK